MRPRSGWILVALGLALFVFDLAMGVFLDMDPDVMQAFDMLLMPSGVFLFAEGAIGLWRAHRLGPFDKP